ncbi:hypothetical protein WMY93_020923 [Mugilogobius chulae]|uniref:AP complex mu/sigma subunit domain-containing protein n=1 Tax=Mugilogobius chulae TaxID=88201 RepID=A0AAW0N992_9GOBI
MPPKVSINTEEYVTITQVRELLDQQKDFYKTLLEQQERSFKTCLQVFVDSSNKRIDDMSKLMYDFKQSLEMTQKDFDDYKASSSTLSKSCNEIRSDLDTICKSLLAFSDKAEHLEGQSKRNNIVIEGIKESGKEAMADCEDKVRKLFIEKLQLDHLKIELDRVYRAGKPLSGNLERPRPVVVRFLRLKDKMAVLDRAKRLKGTGIFINEDFPETVRQKRKELLPAMKAARERGSICDISVNTKLCADHHTPIPLQLCTLTPLFTLKSTTEYASLYFCAGLEDQDNELLTLEVLHRYVELLDKYFGNVCELDIIFNFEKAYFILDEFLMGGEILETSRMAVGGCLEEADTLQETMEEYMSRPAY